MAGSVQDIAQAIFQLFRDFSWFHVTMLMDNGATAEIYGLIFEASKKLVLTEDYQNFQLEGTTFDVTSIDSMRKAIELASGRSRGMWFPKE